MRPPGNPESQVRVGAQSPSTELVRMSRKIYPRISTLAYESLIPNICVLPDAAQWQSTCRSLIERHIRRRQPLNRVAQNLALDITTAADLVSMVKPSIDALMKDPRGASIDCLLCDERDSPRANAIGRAMYGLLRQGLLARYFVRDVVLQYAARAKQIGLERGSEVHDDFDYARLLACFVNALGIKDLAIRFILSCRKEIGSAELNMIRDELDVPPNLPWVIRQQPATRRSPTGTLIGIEVVQCIPDKQSVVDKAFQSAILLAEVFEPWRFSSAGQDHSPG